MKKYIWTLIGITTTLISSSILYDKLRNISFYEVVSRLKELTMDHWILAIFSALVSYAALAGYDRIALRHLQKNISWIFITICSFTTYALSHNIGFSIFSGAAVRYRAYSIKGLNGAEIAVLVGFCSFTFALGTLFLSSIVLLIRPDLIKLVHNDFPESLSIIISSMILTAIGCYIFGSWMQIHPPKIGKKIKIAYPSLKIVLQQLIIGPLEILGAVGIIYALLPEANNPGFIPVLAVFLAAFSLTLLSNAPAGGIGVLETLFMTGTAKMNQADVLAALAIFRLLYLLIPLILSVVVIVLFEIIYWNPERKRNKQ
ncbi:MAG: hypothetical protein JSC161_000773 [Candidatus Tokpelaia sp. JSC161]|jgi:hypothetical protein|nr:MAG: hypothetical protein JSC161_000773 [Candidatus Tokpelaia sp. JSC161]